MKKRLVALLLTTVMVFALAACTVQPAAPSTDPASSSVNTSSAAPAEPTKLTLWSFSDLHVAFYEDMLQRWNAENPDNQLELECTVYPFDDMHNKLTMALQSNTGAPDLVDIEIGKYANYLKGDIQLAPLNDIVEPELDNIVRGRVDMYARNGNFYGIDFHIGAAVTFYNAELCEAADVDYTSIKTWDDYYEAGKKFAAANPDAAWTSLEVTDLWHMIQMVYSQGSDIIAGDGSPNIATPEMAKALEYNQKLLNEGIAIVAPGNYHHSEEFYGLMNNDGVASISMPMWYMSRFLDYMPDTEGKIAIAPCPVFEAGQKRSVGLGGTGTSITMQCKNMDAAKAFLSFAKLSKEGNMEEWRQLGFDPIRTEVWELDEIRNDPTNKFLSGWFVNNPFDVLTEIKDEISGINLSDAFPPTMEALKSSVFYRAYEEKVADIPAMLAEEQAKIQY